MRPSLKERYLQDEAEAPEKLEAELQAWWDRLRTTGNMFLESKLTQPQVNQLRAQYPDAQGSTTGFTHQNSIGDYRRFDVVGEEFSPSAVDSRFFYPSLGKEATVVSWRDAGQTPNGKVEFSLAVPHKGYRGEVTTWCISLPATVGNELREQLDADPQLLFELFWKGYGKVLEPVDTASDGFGPRPLPLSPRTMLIVLRVPESAEVKKELPQVQSVVDAKRAELEFLEQRTPEWKQAVQVIPFYSNREPQATELECFNERERVSWYYQTLLQQARGGLQVLEREEMSPIARLQRFLARRNAP